MPLTTLSAPEPARLAAAGMQPVQGSLAWTTREVRDKSAFCRRLGPEDLRELDEYLGVVRGRPLEDVRPEELHGPHLQRFLCDMREEVQQGYGMVIIQGCTLERYSRADFEHIFWGMGLFLGRPISQSVFGERIAHVRHVAHNPNNRSYRSTRELIHHTDTPDALGLMCVRTAKSGGLSTAVSALALYNEVLRTRPDLVGPLLRGAPYHRLGQELPGQEPVSPYDVPVFSTCEGQVSCMYVRHMMTQGATASGRPLPADLQEALDYFDALATSERFALHFAFSEGDIMFVNNRTMLHARTEYEDHDDPEYKRDLLRLWLELPEGQRPVLPEVDPYQQPASGGRGGVAPQPAKAAA